MSELCMNCFSVKGQYEVCPYCGYIEGTPPKQPHYLTPGTVLGNRFIVGTAIGVGGFGITYKCFDSTLGVIVAVKEFYPAGLVNRAPGESRVGLLSGDKKGKFQEQLQRFLLEAQSVAQFGKAKDIVNVFDFFEENGTAYIVMEYIDGVLLKDYLEKQGAIAPEAAMSIITPIIEAVKKIHSKGIIHRDISPDNIFIADENTIKIFDFGAAILNNSKEGMAAEPVIKVGYSPLEQYRDKGRQGFYTDVYAVGAILYQMLTGVKPIESTEREFKDELKSPQKLGAKIGGNIDRAVMEALAVRTELRFQNIQEFQDALLNKRIAEDPKEKLKAKRRTRNWTLALAATAVLTVGVGVGLYSTILQPQTNIFEETIREPTEIVVWVENEDQKEQIGQIVENGFKQGETNTENEQLKKMQEENENVQVKIKVKKNMEKALQTAAQKGNLPNMFLTDHVSNISDYELISLKNSVYEALNEDDYYFLPEKIEWFRDMKELPTGLDTLLLYACDIDYHKDNTLLDSKYLSHGEQSISLEELIASEPAKVKIKNQVDNTFLNDSLAFITSEEEVANVLLFQENMAWAKAANKKGTLSEKMIKNLAAIQTFCVEVKEEKDSASYQINKSWEEKEEYEAMYGTTILSGAAYRKTINYYMEKDENADVVKKGANPLSDYKTYVVTNADGKMLVEFSEKYAITKSSDNAQQLACERLLWVMLSDIGQAQKNKQTATTFPIRKSQLEKFSSYNGKFVGFPEMVKVNYPCIVLEPDNRALVQFVEGLGTRKKEEKIQQYAEKYINTED